MTQVLINDISEAVTSTVQSATGLARTQAAGSMTEGMNATPTFQFYFERLETDSASANMERSTFRGGITQTSLIFHGDLYVRQRSHIGEDMAALYPMADAIIAILEAQKLKPYFGLEGIKGFRWTVERATFRYGSDQLLYIGARFIMRFLVF